MKSIEDIIREHTAYKLTPAEEWRLAFALHGRESRIAEQAEKLVRELRHFIRYGETEQGAEIKRLENALTDGAEAAGRG